MHRIEKVKEVFQPAADKASFSFVESHKEKGRKGPEFKAFEHSYGKEDIGGSCLDYSVMS